MCVFLGFANKVGSHSSLFFIQIPCVLLAIFNGLLSVSLLNLCALVATFNIGKIRFELTCQQMMQMDRSIEQQLKTGNDKKKLSTHIGKLF